MSDQLPIQIQFGTQLATHVSGPLSSELAENLFFEKAPPGSKSDYTLIGTPGLKLFSTPQETGPVRGLLPFNNALYAVIGGSLYRLTQDGTAVLVGAISGTANVAMAENGSWMWIAVEGGALFASDGTVIEDLSASLSGLVAVTSQDGYIIGAEGGTNVWYLSGLDTAANTVSAFFTSADTLSGDLVSIISDHREVLAVKDNSIEAYYNSGAADFPFQRSQVVERGCGAPNSVAKYKNSVFWIGDDFQVYAMAGYQPQLVSTPTVARIIENRKAPNTAQGWTYQQSGHGFYVLSFSDYCMVLDIDTGMWHRRRSYNTERWNVATAAYMRNWRKHIVGDTLSGKLFELSETTYDENGEPLVREAVAPPVWNNNQRFIIDELVVDIEAGVGLQNGRETAWAQSTAYSVGDLVSANGSVYECVVAGTSTAQGSGPAGEGSSIEEVDFPSLVTAIGNIATAYNRHAANIGGTFHSTVVGRPTPMGGSASPDFGSVAAYAKDMKDVFEDHRTDISTDAHPTDDDTNTITSPDYPTTFSGLVALINELRADYETHRADATYHVGADGANGVTGSAFVLSTVRWKFVQTEDWGEDPKVILDWSKDGAKTWSARLLKTFGKIGEREVICEFARLGTQRNWIPRIRISDPVPVRINGAYIRPDRSLT